MKKVLLVLMLVLCAFPADARGIKGLVSDYLDTVENRLAMQPLAAPGTAAEARLRELDRAEEALETELQRIFRGGDDVAEVAMGFLAEAVTGEALLYFRSMIPTDSPSPAARRLLILMKELEGRQRVGGPAPEAVPVAMAAERAAAGPWGAAIFPRADFRGRAATLVAAGKSMRLTGRQGRFAACTDGAGRRGFVFLGSVVFPDGPEPWSGPAAGRSPEVDIPPDLSLFQRIHDQKPTYYVTAREEGFPTSGPLYGHSYDGSERKSIKTPAGALIAETNGRYFAALCMEGSGVIRDGRTVSFVSDQRFQVAPAGCLGITATGHWVVPFHTLAVNRQQMPFRGVYFVPGTRGLKLPNGETHDGYWFAHDTGSAFTNATDRMDMYVDRDEFWKWMEANFTPSFTPVKVYKVDQVTRDRVYAKYQSVLGRH